MKVNSLQIFTASIICAITLLGAPARAETTSNNPTMKQLKVSVNTGSFAKITNNTLIVASANHKDDPPFMNGEPEHIRLTFDGEKLSDYTDYLQKQLLIYPLKPYAVMFKGEEKIAFDKGLAVLKKVIAAKSTKGIKQIPLLPAAEATEAFHNQVKFLNFKQGSGIAFLTCYQQDAAPIENGDLFYTFQGLTADGKYYLAFYCPVKAKALPAMSSAQKTVQYLSKTTAAQFAPDLNTIDSMLETISIK